MRPACPDRDVDRIVGVETKGHRAVLDTALEDAAWPLCWQAAYTYYTALS